MLKIALFLCSGYCCRKKEQVPQMRDKRKTAFIHAAVDAG